MHKCRPSARPSEYCLVDVSRCRELASLPPRRSRRSCCAMRSRARSTCSTCSTTSASSTPPCLVLSRGRSTSCDETTATGTAPRVAPLSPAASFTSSPAFWSGAYIHPSSLARGGSSTTVSLADRPVET